jgi:hypothetical protein
MPRDVNGNTSPLPGTLVSTGDTVLPSQHNPMVNDLYAMMSQSLSRDGQGGMRTNLDMGSNRVVNVSNGVSASDAVTLAQVQALIAAIVSIPTGIIAPLASSVIPSGWVRLDGASVSRVDYAALWAFAQTSGALAPSEGAKTAGQFGPGNGTTTFTLPNLEADGGYFIRPITAGRTNGNIQADALASHSHTASFSGNAVPDHQHLGLGVSGLGGVTFGNGAFAPGQTLTTAAGGHTPSGSVTVNATGSTETRPKNISYVYIIKA